MQKKHTILTVVKAAHENDDNRSTDEETAGSLAPLLINALTENFYALMPPTRIHQPVCLRNPPTSFMLKDISTYVQDDADKGAIALQAYCPPFDDNDGKF